MWKLPEIFHHQHQHQNTQGAPQIAHQVLHFHFLPISLYILSDPSQGALLSPLGYLLTFLVCFDIYSSSRTPNLLCPQPWFVFSPFPPLFDYLLGCNPRYSRIQLPELVIMLAVCSGLNFFFACKTFDSFSRFAPNSGPSLVSCPTRWSLYWPLALCIDHLVREERREEREDIFSQVFTMIHIKSFVQNIQTKTEMEPHDQFWPSSCDTLILLDQFLLSWHSFLSCSISYVVSREGKCHLQPKIVHIIFKKSKEKNSIFICC